MSDNDFERIVEFVRAYDRKAEGYGIHGVDLRMVLKGPKGATQFALSTGWYLPETIGCEPSQWGGVGHDYGDKLARFGLNHPMPTDLGYHSPTPQYEGQTSMGPCDYLDGAECYYDGSGLNAARPFEALLREGGEGVWKVLFDYYFDLFESQVPA